MPQREKGVGRGQRGSRTVMFDVVATSDGAQQRKKIKVTKRHKNEALFDQAPAYRLRVRLNITRQPRSQGCAQPLSVHRPTALPMRAQCGNEQGVNTEDTRYRRRSTPARPNQCAPRLHEHDGSTRCSPSP